MFRRTMEHMISRIWETFGFGTARLASRGVVDNTPVYSSPEDIRNAALELIASWEAAASLASDKQVLQTEDGVVVFPGGACATIRPFHPSMGSTYGELRRRALCEWAEAQGISCSTFDLSYLVFAILGTASEWCDAPVVVDTCGNQIPRERRMVLSPMALDTLRRGLFLDNGRVIDVTADEARKLITSLPTEVLAPGAWQTSAGVKLWRWNVHGL